VLLAGHGVRIHAIHPLWQYRLSTTDRTSKDTAKERS